MTDPFLDSCGGWTPTPDILTRDKRYGFEGAYLWGRLRRLCQLGGGKYAISHEALGERIGMSRRTVIKYLDRLIEDGYVEDLDSGIKNRAHTYSTKKGEDKILNEVGVQISHTNSDTVSQNDEVTAELDTSMGMRILHTNENECAEIAQPDGLGVQNLPTRYAEIAQDGMQNLHLNRDSLETPKEREESRLTPKQELAKQITETCGYDATNLLNGTRHKLEKARDSLWAKKATPALVKEFGDKYWFHPGPPTADQLTEEWGRFIIWRTNGNQSPANKSSPGPAIHKAQVDEEKLRLLQEGKL